MAPSEGEGDTESRAPRPTQAAAPSPAALLEPTRVLAWRPTLELARVAAGAAFLIGERERFVLSGAAAVEIAALVDGRRTVRDLLRAARGRVSELEALYTLRQLAARGHLVAAAPDVPAAHAAFWDGVGIPAAAATEALRAAPVAVQTVGDAAFTGWMTEALAQAGVRVDAAAAIRVVVTDDPLRPELGAINRRALRDGTRWFCSSPPASSR